MDANERQELNRSFAIYALVCPLIAWVSQCFGAIGGSALPCLVHLLLFGLQICLLIASCCFATHVLKSEREDVTTPDMWMAGIGVTISGLTLGLVLLMFVLLRIIAEGLQA